MLEALLVFPSEKKKKENVWGKPFRGVKNKPSLRLCSSSLENLVLFWGKGQHKWALKWYCNSLLFASQPLSRTGCCVFPGFREQEREFFSRSLSSLSTSKITALQWCDNSPTIYKKNSLFWRQMAFTSSCLFSCILQKEVLLWAADCSVRRVTN